MHVNSSLIITRNCTATIKARTTTQTLTTRLQLRIKYSFKYLFHFQTTEKADKNMHDEIQCPQFSIFFPQFLAYVTKRKILSKYNTVLPLKIWFTSLDIFTGLVSFILTPTTETADNLSSPQLHSNNAKSCTWTYFVEV